MEKTIDLKHGNFKAVIPQPERFFMEHDFNVETFEKTSRYSSPQWKAYKASLLDEYTTTGFPAWRRSKLARLELPPLEEEPQFDIEHAGMVSITKLEESREALELAKKTEFEGSDKKFVLQSVVFNSSGIFVVGKGSDGFVAMKLGGESQKSVLLHNVFLVRKGSRLKVVNILESSSYVSVLNRYIVEEGGELSVLNIRTGNTFSFTNEIYRVASSAKVNSYSIDKPGYVHAPFALSLLEGKGASTRLNNTFTASGSSIVDSMYVMRHRAAETHGKIEGSGVLFDSARSVFRGNIEIAKGSVNTETGESVNVVLLSPQARADSIPALFVEENEVTASHAASVGALNEEGLYYLMTRGLDENSAIRLVVRGIFEPTLQDIGSEFGSRWQEVAESVLTGKSP